MTPIEDIPRDREPEAASTPPTPEPPATAAARRGHFAKIAEAVAELRIEKKLPPNLRSCVRDKRIQERLITMGYGDDLPDRFAIRRAMARIDQP